MENKESLENSQPNEVQETKFDESYVKKLREENASYRVKAKELESKLEEISKKDAEEKGKYKELYEKKQSEYEQLLEKHSSYETIVKSIEEKEENKRQDLLKTIPKEYQDLYKDATIEQIEVFSKLLKGTSEGAPKEPVNSFEPKSLRDLAKYINKGR